MCSAVLWCSVLLHYYRYEDGTRNRGYIGHLRAFCGPLSMHAYRCIGTVRRPVIYHMAMCSTVSSRHTTTPPPDPRRDVTYTTSSLALRVGRDAEWHHLFYMGHECAIWAVFCAMPFSSASNQISAPKQKQSRTSPYVVDYVQGKWW